MLATGFGAGLAPIAPGTVGSALAVLLFVPLRGLPVGVYLLVVAGVTVVGVWAAGVTQLATGRPDDGRIVIDEVAGQLLTLCPLLWVRPLGAGELAALLVTGFVAFRVLDIWKPGPVRWAERGLAGGTGVMADDVVAGALGAALLLLGLVLAGALGLVADPFVVGAGS